MTMIDMYPWVKAFHIIFIVCWFSCLFYLPRLFINTVLAEDDATKARLTEMQRKLYRFSNPFMGLTIIFGVWLVAILPHLASQPWFHIKMLFLLFLVAYHITCGRFMKSFVAGTNTRSSKFYRFFNEALVVILLVMVIMAVAKPFSA